MHKSIEFWLFHEEAKSLLVLDNVVAHTEEEVKSQREHVESSGLFGVDIHNQNIDQVKEEIIGEYLVDVQCDGALELTDYTHSTDAD